MAFRVLAFGILAVFAISFAAQAFAPAAHTPAGDESEWQVPGTTHSYPATLTRSGERAEVLVPKLGIAMSFPVAPHSIRSADSAAYEVDANGTVKEREVAPERAYRGTDETGNVLSLIEGDAGAAGSLDFADGRDLLFEAHEGKTYAYWAHDAAPLYLGNDVVPSPVAS